MEDEDEGEDSEEDADGVSLVSDPPHAFFFFLFPFTAPLPFTASPPFSRLLFPFAGATASGRLFWSSRFILAERYWEGRWRLVNSCTQIRNVAIEAVISLCTAWLDLWINSEFGFAVWPAGASPAAGAGSSGPPAAAQAASDPPRASQSLFRPPAARHLSTAART